MTRKDLIDIINESDVAILTDDELIQVISNKKNIDDITKRCLDEYARRRNFNGITISKPEQVMPFLTHFALDHQENFGLVLLNGNREIIDIKVLYKGTSNGVTLYTREIMREVIKSGASAFIAFHNHPSGNIEPSDHDNNTTDTLVKASEILGVQMLDHIIISLTNFYSYLEHGII